MLQIPPGQQRRPRKKQAGLSYPCSQNDPKTEQLTVSPEGVQQPRKTEEVARDCTLGSSDVDSPHTFSSRKVEKEVKAKGKVNKRPCNCLFT